MAKVMLEFDTKDKTMKATVDGVVMENVIGAEVYRRGYYYGSDDDNDENQFSFCLSQAEKDKDNDMTKHTRICASNHPEASLSDAVDIPGLVGVKRIPGTSKSTSDAVKSIVEYFSKD